MSAQVPFSVVMPAYNEEGGIGPSLQELQEVLSGLDYELIVVDDGSVDDTARIAEEAGATVLRQPENRGYGASLKTGIRAAKHDRIVITDADGNFAPPFGWPQYPASDNESQGA